MTWKTIHKWWVRLGTAALVVFLAWGLICFQDWGVDPAVLATGGNVVVRISESDIRFLPRRSHSTGLLFFPGALVDPEAYAPFLRSIAEKGYPVVLVKLPLRGFSTEAAAVEAEVRARRALGEQAEVKRWIAGGHSKGGLFACRVALALPESVERLVLIGTAHPREIDLTRAGFGVTKILATKDGMASPERARASAHRVPVDTRWVVIEGGNHSQFAHYGFQFGDRFATISRDEQQARALREVLADLSGTTTGDTVAP